jgi:plasmid maintenance system antidote protein VapI
MRPLIGTVVHDPTLMLLFANSAPGRINQIIKGKRGITSEDTALRLAKYFGNSPEFWLNLQQMYDLSKTRLESGARIEQEVRVGKRIA